MNFKTFFYLSVVSLAVACNTSTEKTGETTEQTAEAETLPGQIDARVFFVNLNDGDTITSPVEIEMGVEGMTVEPAGMVVEGKGHHHLIIDGDYIPEGEVVPADETHIHYGKGQTQVEVSLEPGEHTLTLQFADGVHVSYGESLSNTITVIIAESTLQNESDTE